jgi:hypothetical protein
MPDPNRIPRLSELVGRVLGSSVALRDRIRMVRWNFILLTGGTRGLAKLLDGVREVRVKSRSLALNRRVLKGRSRQGLRKIASGSREMYNMGGTQGYEGVRRSDVGHV